MTVRVALGKLLSRPVPRALVESYAASLGGEVEITDARGRMVLETGPPTGPPTVPTTGPGGAVAEAVEVVCDDCVVGTVRGGAAAGLVAGFLEGLCALEVERKALGQEALDRYREITFLYDFTEKVGAQATPREVAELIASEARTLIWCDTVSVWLRDPGGGGLAVAVALGGAGEGTRDLPEEAGRPEDVELAEQVAGSGEHAVVHCSGEDGREQSLVVVPMRTKHDVIGVLRLGSKERHEYGSQDVKLALALTSQGAIAIENARSTELLAAHRDRLEQEVAERTRSLNEALVELTRANEMLDRLSLVDGLTGVANRRSFDRALDSAWTVATHEGSEVALVMIDVDCFKAYNDTYGHQAGDECLRRVADALCSAVRTPADIVARYGGEEFAVVLTATGLAEACTIGERMRSRVEELVLPHASSTVGAAVTISVGVAAGTPDSAGTPDDLVARADGALYRAKHEGRNRVRS